MGNFFSPPPAVAYVPARLRDATVHCSLAWDGARGWSGLWPALTGRETCVVDATIPSIALQHRSPTSSRLGSSPHVFLIHSFPGEIVARVQAGRASLSVSDPRVRPYLVGRTSRHATLCRATRPFKLEFSFLPEWLILLWIAGVLTPGRFGSTQH